MSLEWKGQPVPPDHLPWLYRAQPSPNTTYMLFDHGSGNVMGMCQEKKGAMWYNTQVFDGAIPDAQKACQADWDSGLRS